MGFEDTRTKDSTCVRMGLSLACQANLAIKCVDSFLCNRPCVTLDPPGVYLNRGVSSKEGILITLVIQARLLGFSHYNLVVDQLL